MSHSMDFVTLPDVPRLTLANLTVPSCLVGASGSLAPFEITIEGGRIASGAGERVDMRGAMVFPAFVDVHTHLDKSQIWSRAPNPDGTSDSARLAVAADRTARWSAADVRRRMEFALRSAFAHGTRAIRTHLDSFPPQHAISFGVFRELRAAWAGRIDLQAVNLCSVDVLGDEAGLRSDRGGGRRFRGRARLHRHAASGASPAARRPPRDGRDPWNGGGPARRRDRRSFLRQPSRRRRVRDRDRVRRPAHRRPLLLARGPGGGGSARHPRPRRAGGLERGEPPDVQPVPPGPGRRPGRPAGAGSPSCTR